MTKRKRNMSDIILEDTDNFFKFELPKEDDSLKWKAVENFLRCKSNEIQKLCYNYWCFDSFRHDKIISSQRFCKILLNSLQEFRCDNKIVITSLTDLITIFYLNNQPQLTYLTSEKFENYVKSAINNLEGLTENSVFPKNEGIHLFTTFTGNYELMEILVKYGLIKSFSRESPLLKARTKEIIRHLVGIAYRDDGLVDNEIYDIRLDRNSKKYVRMEKKLFPKKSNRSSERIFLTALALMAVLYSLRPQSFFPLKERDSKIANYLKCLRMYFAATTDPFITLNEMNDFLNVCLTHIKKQNLVVPYYEVFKELMPNSKENFEPRKLKELCRIQVRQNLSRCKCTLPLAIEKSKLPNTLKNFISFNMR